MDTGHRYGLIDVGVSLARQWMLLILVPLLVAVSLAGPLLSKEVKFTAVARLLPPQQNKETSDFLLDRVGGTSAIANSALTIKNPTDLYIGIMSSRSVMNRISKKLDLGQHYDETEPFKIIKSLEENTKIRAAKDGIINILVTDKSAEMAANIANAYISAFYERAEEISDQDARRRDAYYKRLVDKARVRLDKADDELRKTEERTGLVRLSGQEQAIVQSVVELSALINVASAKLQSLRLSSTERNPDVQRARRELNSLIAKRRSLEEKRAQMLIGKSKVSPKRGNNTSILVPLNDVPQALSETIKKRREVKYSEIMYELVGRSYELSKVDVSRDIALLQVLDYAVPPAEKSGPRVMLTLIGAMFATLVWTVVIIVIVDSIRLDQRRRSGFKRLLYALIRRPGATT